MVVERSALLAVNDATLGKACQTIAAQVSRVGEMHVNAFDADRVKLRVLLQILAYANRPEIVLPKRSELLAMTLCEGGIEAPTRFTCCALVRDQSHPRAI